MAELTNDQLLAVLQERLSASTKAVNDRIDTLIIRDSEFHSSVEAAHEKLNDAMRKLEFRERERNGNIDTLFKRMTAHDEWHGKNDSGIIGRLDKLEMEEHDARIIKETRNRILSSQLKVFFGGVTIGLSSLGGIIGVLKLIGWA